MRRLLAHNLKNHAHPDVDFSERFVVALSEYL